MEGGWALQKYIDFIMLIYILIFFSFRGGVTDMISKSFHLQDENAKRNGKLIHVANQPVILYDWNRTSIAEESPGIETQVIPYRLRSTLAWWLVHYSTDTSLSLWLVVMCLRRKGGMKTWLAEINSNPTYLFRKREIEHSFWKIVNISETSKI